MTDTVRGADLIGAARLVGLDLTEREAENYAQTLTGLLKAARALPVPQEVEPAATVAPPEVHRGQR